MKRIKKIITMGLAVMMAVSAMSVSAFAANAFTPTTAKENGIMPLDTSIIYTNDYSASNGKFSDSFYVPGDMPYLKAFVHNTSNNPVTVTIHKNSSTGTIVAQGPVKANDTNLIYSPGALSAGRYYIVVNSGNSSSISGSINIKVGSTPGELGGFRFDGKLVK